MKYESVQFGFVKAFEAMISQADTFAHKTGEQHCVCWDREYSMGIVVPLGFAMGMGMIVYITSKTIM
jgi:hypothetical protein